MMYFSQHVRRKVLANLEAKANNRSDYEDKFFYIFSELNL